MGDGNQFINLNHQNSSPESWKMTRYITGMSITRFASFLAWTGMVASIIFMIAALNLIFTPLSMGFAHVCSHYRYYNMCAIFYGVGFPVLALNIGMFIYSFKLWKTISTNDMIGMKTLIKIGCYIMGGLELFVCAAGVVTPLVFIIFLSFSSHQDQLIGLLFIPIIIFAMFTVFVSLMIHGVRKFKIGLVNINIIFKIVLFSLFAILMLISIIMSFLNYRSIAAMVVMSDINLFLLYSFFYFYYNGYIVLQYNIMVGNKTEEGSLDLSDSNIHFSNNVYFKDENSKV